MTRRNVEDKFERAWLAKFSHSLEETVGSELKEKIMENSSDTASTKGRLDWTGNAMALLDFYVTDENKKDILNNCACFYHFEDILNQYKRWYEEEPNLIRLHERMRTDFETRIKKFLKDQNVDADFINQVLKENWGEIGRIEGNTITVTKMPANITEYLAAPTKEARDYAYCYCNRIKDVLLYENKNISPTYCYCGGGFYTSMWESIIGKPVEIKLKKSLLNGNNTCSFEIIFPTF